MSTGHVQDKTNKTNSNWRTIDVSPVRTVRGFMQIQKCLMDLLNVNGHRTDMPNVKKMDIDGFHQTMFNFHLVRQSGKV